MPLTDKQKRFIDEYVIDQNATQAYKRAGYKVRSAASAHACAAKLLRNATLRAEIDKRLAALAVKTRMTAEEAWAESRCIAASDIGDIIDMTGPEPRLKPVNQIPASARRAIKSVKVKRYLEGSGENAREVEVMEFTFWDKPGQIVARLKALGELRDTLELTGKDGAALPGVNIYLPDNGRSKPDEPANDGQKGAQ